MKAKVAYAVLLCLMGYGACAMASGEKRGLSPIILLLKGSDPFNSDPFNSDVPYVPAPETPIVLAAADTAGAGTRPQPDFVYTACKETPSAGDTTTAMNGVHPIGMLRTYIANRDNRVVDQANIKNLTLIEGTKHGELVPHTSGSGILYYMYAPIPEYDGDDRAVFMAEFEGKRYKIVVNLKVQMYVDENTPLCPQPQLIKVTKPTSGASSYGSDYYNLASVSVTFADLPGSAVGQTVGTSITLDTNAAGHGWYVDANPWDNSEYLATSQLKGVASH